jgi:hypothetical protein
MDLSSSMLAEDFTPNNRLDVAKRTALDFVRARPSDRIGVVAFAGQALTQVPVTMDHAVVEAALQDLHIGALEDGTAIGTGIATAANRLRRAPGKRRSSCDRPVNNRGTVIRAPPPTRRALSASGSPWRRHAREAPVPTGQGGQGLAIRCPWRSTSS